MPSTADDPSVADELVAVAVPLAEGDNIPCDSYVSLFLFPIALLSEELAEDDDAAAEGTIPRFSLLS